MNVFETITNQIIKDMESATSEFVMPWHSTELTMPMNIEGRPYSGINVLTLWARAMNTGYDCNVWGTYKQWQAKGANVRKGEKSIKIIFWKWLDITEDGETRKIPMARAYSVFNGNQVDGWESPVADTTNKVDVLAAVEEFVVNTKANIQHGGNRACYIPGEDKICMPDQHKFVGTAEYYSTLLHELAHWTGAETRLDRKLKNGFGSEEYAFEELVAELSAAFSCATLGITNHPRQSHAQYIKSWIKALKSDKKYIFKAARMASKATEYLINLQTADNASEAA